MPARIHVDDLSFLGDRFKEARERLGSSRVELVREAGYKNTNKGCRKIRHIERGEPPLADERAGRPVVVKWFAGGGTGSRFINDATYQLDHPNIPRVLDVGRVCGLGFLAREYVDGVDLRELAKVLPGEQKSAVACEVMRQLCELCVYLGEQRDHDMGFHGIMHRWLELKNVLVSTRGQVKLINFDYAETPLSEEREATRTKYVVINRPSTKNKRPRLSNQESLFLLLYKLFAGHSEEWEGDDDILKSPFGMPMGLVESLETREAEPRELLEIVNEAVAEEGLEIESERVGEFVESLDGYREF